MPFTLIAGGDIIMSVPLKADLSKITARIKQADLSTANLECVVTDRKDATDKFINLSMSPDLISDFAEIGFDTLTFANNHALDFGIDGMRDTLDHVRRHAMGVVGAGENLAESIAGTVVERAGMRIALLGASSTLPNSSAAGSHTPGIAPLRVNYSFRIDTTTLDESPGMAPYVETTAVDADLNRLCETVSRHKSHSDLVVVHLHWGVPLGWSAATQHEIADYQRPVAHALIDAGANLIIGHHPHVIQGVEFYKRTPILYSLGNFIKHKIAASPGRDGVHPPYDLSTLQGMWNRLGALAEISWANPGAQPACCFHVLQIDENGEPSLANLDAAQAVARRIGPQCSGWNTKVEVHEARAGHSIVFE